ncbi:amidohydrolase family protein [Desertivirga arenae]|uniref:amidohydrolase family protein n=1 Tax=Desertivirga arenae TaxID=2810309 RepID=UPI001A96AA7D|nr:amidohydrolase family protein [Pedobacter sp. SYSU D00823]
MKIDSHQHFWKFDPIRDSWINDEMKTIQRDFLPPDLLPLLQENGLDGCIAVQSDQSEVENSFQLNNAEQYDFIKGVVGWVDLQAEDIQERLEYYSQFPKLKGFRHVLQGEPQRDFMLRSAFKNGIGLLHKYNFTYDILIFPDQLTYSKELVAAFPDQPFVVDHIAKPYIRDNKIDEWKRDLKALAQFENVSCKISGMVTEADWKKHAPVDFKPYIDAVVESFGTDRIMFGSDWPVCLVAESYAGVFRLVEDYFSTFSQGEQDNFFGNNAVKFYKV